MVESPPLEIQIWPIDRLVFYARNPRKNDCAIDRMISEIVAPFFRCSIATTWAFLLPSRGPVGTTVTFTPTEYFGYYYSDVSDEEDQNGPAHGCWAYTIFTFNDEDCTAAGAPPNVPGQGDHVFAIFVQPSTDPTYWIAGQDPFACNQDGDCNLTIVKVSRAED